MKATAARAMLPVPKEFVRHDVGQSFLMISQHLALTILPLAVAVYATNLQVGPVLTYVVVAAMTLLSSFGLHNLGLMAHEGTHFTLHPRRIVSAYMGVLTSSLVPFHLDMGFAIHHNQHHRFINTDKDPDVKLFKSFKSFFSRLFLARLKASNQYLQTTLQLALADYPPEWDSMLNLTRHQIIGLARVNIIVASVSITIFYVMIGLAHPMFGIAFSITFAWAILLSGLRPYLEHACTNSSGLTIARTWTSPIFDFLYGGINYHMAHHLSPAVPAYRIKKFHHWLVTHNYISSDQIVEIETLGEALFVVKRLPYAKKTI